MKDREAANKRLAITSSTLKRLMKRAHYGQTQNGVLVELLDLVDKIECNKVTDNNDKPLITPKEKI